MSDVRHEIPYERVREAGTALFNKKGRQALADLLAAYGVGHAKKLKSSDYGKFISACYALERDGDYKLSTTRDQALKSGSDFYEGKPCINCGNKKRYISGNCHFCQTVRNYGLRQRALEADERSHEELDAWAVVIEACQDHCGTVVLDKHAQRAALKIEKQLERLHRIEDAAVMLAKAMSDCDMTHPDPDQSKGDELWEQIANFHATVRSAVPSARLKKIWDNLENWEKDEDLDESEAA